MIGDCQYTIRCSKRLSADEHQTPIVVLSLSFSADANPLLLAPSQAENLFHEMGHAMHSMLGRTIYQHVAG